MGCRLGVVTPWFEEMLESYKVGMAHDIFIGDATIQFTNLILKKTIQIHRAVNKVNGMG